MRKKVIEHPILFNTAMVEAILDGRKTVTRRPVKYNHMLGDPARWKKLPDVSITGELSGYCPYGNVGDHLWVRETFRLVKQDGGYQRWRDKKIYKAGNKDLVEWKWKPAIHMPRWVSRIDLEITSIHIEKLHDIDFPGMFAEGFLPCSETWNATEGNRKQTRVDFANEWDYIYDKNHTVKWNRNPWVWVIEFKRIYK
jgi:hypothetical protein